MIHNSIKQASIQLSIPYKRFKAAKALGCPNFIGWRVDDGGLINWMEQHKLDIDNWITDCPVEGESHAELKRKKTMKEIEKLEVTISKIKESSIQLEDVQAFFAKLGSVTQALLTKYIIQEMPAKFAGLTESEIRAKSGPIVDDILTEFQSLPNFWNKDK